jgi:fucose 4-O-acetylase-like acetyltransferase
VDVLKKEAIDFCITGNGTVWFLMTLFIAESLFVWLKTYKKNWMLIGLAVALAIIPFMWNSNNPFLIVLGRAMAAYSLIVLGWFASSLLKFKKLIAILSAVLFVVWLWIVYNTNWDYSFFDGCFNSIGATIPVIICGCLAICLLFSFCSKKYDYLQYIGKNSMVLMLVHPTFLLIGIYGLYPRLHLHGDIQLLLFSIILTIAVYGLSLLCVPLIHKYLPFVIGEKKETGNNK